MTKKVDPRAADLAIYLVNHDRGEDYGDFDANMNSTAKLWSARLGIDITGEEVAQLMVLFKIDRMRYAYKQDNYTDAIGYLLIADNIQAEKCKPEPPKNANYNPIDETR